MLLNATGQERSDLKKAPSPALGIEHAGATARLFYAAQLHYAYFSNCAIQAYVALRSHSTQCPVKAVQALRAH
eukprot:5186922-Pleurochrysis_carterae.AAC.1